MYPSPFHFIFSYGRRKTFPSHLRLQIQPVFPEILEGCIFISKSWYLYLEFKPFDFQFLSVLVHSCGRYWDVSLVFCLLAYLHTSDFSREKAILDTFLEVIGMRGCIALSWNEWQKATGGLLVFLPESTLFPSAEYTRFILLCVCEERILFNHGHRRSCCSLHFRTGDLNSKSFTNFKIWCSLGHMFLSVVSKLYASSDAHRSNWGKISHSDGSRNSRRLDLSFKGGS